ncbi:MAG: hypothetical protein JWN37_905 [Candidatus Nomurabacteria bacterium]|nr:hypothetical protein [Candidatus Nomurabacteria bacterium]
MLRIKKAVNHRSSDEEIMQAINEAGDLRLPSRKHYWPKEGEKKAWVIPGDICDEEYEGDKRKFLHGLFQMVRQGLLEIQRTKTRREDVGAFMGGQFIEYDGRPRFRVKT